MFDAAARRAELQAIYDEGDGRNWSPIKAIAESYGIDKPDGGWEDAIPLIVDAEKAVTDPPVVEEPKPTTESAKAKPSVTDTPWRKVRTDLYGNILPSPWHS